MTNHLLETSCFLESLSVTRDTTYMARCDIGECCSVLQGVAVLQCVAVCCSVLQYVEVCCSALRLESLVISRCLGGGVILKPFFTRDTTYTRKVFFFFHA